MQIGVREVSKFWNRQVYAVTTDFGFYHVPFHLQSLI